MPSPSPPSHTAATVRYINNSRRVMAVNQSSSSLNSKGSTNYNRNHQAPKFLPLKHSIEAAFRHMQVQHESGKLHAPFPSKFVFIYKQEVIVHFVQSVLIYLNEFVSASSAARIEERLKPVSRKSSPTPNLGLIISESSTSNIQGIELETNFGHIGVTTPSPPNGNERVANIESSSISPSKNATDHIIAMNTNPSSQSLATAGTINTNPAACNYNKHPTNGPLNALKNSYVLLARSYSRLLLYCSNFESSIEGERRFFERG